VRAVSSRISGCKLAADAGRGEIRPRDRPSFTRAVGNLFAARNCLSAALTARPRHARCAPAGFFKIERRVMSEALDVMLKIGITERRIRNPHCTQAAQQCRLWPCPRTARRTEALRTFRFTSVAGRRRHSIILKNRQRFFCRCNQLRTTPVRCLRPRSRGPWARSGQGGYHACDALAVMEKSLLLVFVSVVAFVTATPTTSGPQCFFQGLGFLPGGSFSFARGVNADGTVVVGPSNDASGLSQAFRWAAASGMVGLGFLPGGNVSDAHGVNADGTVVVGSSIDASGHSQAFRWTAKRGMVGLGFLPGALGSSANGVNADGTVVVGSSIDASGPGQAFRWTAATGMVGLGFLPGGNFSGAAGVNADGTVVVGGSNNQAFRWVNGTMTGLGFLPGGNGSSANGVNADGTVVVGSSNDASGHGQAFRWTAERGMVGLDFLPGGNRSSATGVNADGTVVVGTADDASGQPQAFRWTAETRVQSVLTLLQAAKADVNLFAGWQLRSANRVSADGTVIVGDGVDPLGLRQGWIARLPKEDNEDCEEDENEDELEGRDQRD